MKTLLVAASLWVIFGAGALLSLPSKCRSDMEFPYFSTDFAVLVCEHKIIVLVFLSLLLIFLMKTIRRI